MSVNIKELAKIIGVSISTISKALNDKSDISEELKVKIRNAAIEYSYSPNPIAKRLVAKKTNTLGVFILNRDNIPLKHYFEFQFLDGIIREANLYNNDILIFTNTNDLSYKKSYIDECKERKLDGAIFLGLREDDPFFENIQTSYIPVCAVDTEIYGENVSFVSSDNKGGIIKALEYLWELGHRDIFFISGCQNAFVSNERLYGYKSFMESKTLFNKEYIFEGNYSFERGIRAGEQLLNKKITAVVSSSDMMALGMMQYLKKNNIRIPDDISIIGFDDIISCEHSEPSLTTIAQNVVTMGRKSVDIVLNGNKSPILVETELIIRNSCKKIN